MYVIQKSQASSSESRLVGAILDDCDARRDAERSERVQGRVGIALALVRASDQRGVELTEEEFVVAAARVVHEDNRALSNGPHLPEERGVGL